MPINHSIRPDLAAAMNPTASSTRIPRIVELDLLRGVAVLGIFLMNIIGLGYPPEAYYNPLVFILSDYKLNTAIWLDGAFANTLVFSILNVLVDQKMMALFSLLFGASTMLFLANLRRTQRSVKYYFIRNAWLLVLGLLHGVLLYLGDVLFIYACCAFVLFFFAGLRAQWQALIGVLLYCIPIVQQWLMQTTVINFSAEQLTQLSEIWHPSQDVVQDYIQFAVNTPYWQWVSENWASYASPAKGVYDWYWNAIMVEVFARSLGMMLLGMALFNSGLLSSQTGSNQAGPNQTKPAQAKPSAMTGLYRQILWLSLLIALPLLLWGLWQNFTHNWQADYSAVGGRVLNHIGTPFLTLAYVAGVLLWSRQLTASMSVHNMSLPLTLKLTVQTSLQQSLQAVGRMALSNYIMQSLIGVLLFNGLGWFAQLNRVDLLLLAAVVFAGQLWFSRFWLQHFRYGPLEWLWRCLTYWQWVSNKK